jgi:hypothetical protein
MSGDYSPPPEQKPPSPMTHARTHDTSCDEPPPATNLSSLVDVDFENIPSSSPQLGGFEGGVFLKTDHSGADLSVSGDIAFASKASSPLVSLDAKVFGATGDGSGHDDEDTGALLGNLVEAAADISTGLLVGERGNGGHQGCSYGEVAEPVVATLFDHVGDLLT